MAEAEIASVMAADGSTVADPEEAACPTTPKDGPDLGAFVVLDPVLIDQLQSENVHVLVHLWGQLPM